MTTLRAIPLLAMILFVSACSHHQPMKKTSYQEEAREGELWQSHRPSLHLKEEMEEHHEQKT